MKRGKVVLFGNGQVASVAYACLTHDSEYEVAGFTVDGDAMTHTTLFGLPVVPFEEVEWHFPVDDHGMLISVSFRNVNRLRAQKYEEAKAKGYTLISYVGSRVLTWPGLELGDNCFIVGNTVIDPFVRIGNDVHIGSGCHIGHHSVIHDHCFLAAQVAVAGAVTVGAYSFLGMNATVRDGVTVAERSVIGAGAAILKDTRAGGVYISTTSRVLPVPSDQMPAAL